MTLNNHQKLNENLHSSSMFQQEYNTFLFPISSCIMKSCIIVLVQRIHIDSSFQKYLGTLYLWMNENLSDVSSPSLSYRDSDTKKNGTEIPS